jgi:hypothetical protein
MRPRLAVLSLILAAAGGAEIIDRIAAVVGREVVTRSEVRREAALESYFGASQPDPAQVLDRLVRQRLIFQEMEQTALPEVSEAEQKQWLAAMKPAGRDPARFGLHPQDLLDYARRQLLVEKFIELRFKTGLQASSQDVEAYYKTKLRPELEKKGVEVPPLDAVRDRVEQAVLEERVTALVEEWMGEMRTRAGVRFPEKEKR